MPRIAAILAVAACMAAVGATTSQADHGKGKSWQRFPAVIQLPTGFQPEGIEIGKGTTFYVGSVATGAIYRGDLRTGQGAILVPAAAGRSAPASSTTTSGSSSQVRPRAARTSTTRARRAVEDVSVRHCADVHQRRRRHSQRRVFHRLVEAVFYKVPIGRDGTLGAAQTITLSGDYTQVAGFNLNGIDATPNGKFLVAVQTANGQLYRIDPATGVAKTISLADGRASRTATASCSTGRSSTSCRTRTTRSPSCGSRPTSRRAWSATHHRPELPRPDDDRRVRSLALRGQRPFGEANPGSLAYQVVQVHK